MASRDDDKLMAGMLRRTLAHSSVPETAAGGNDCPPADILAAYYERSLDDDESKQYELHFSNCAHCREQLAAMVRAEEAPQPKTSWAWLWNPYLLAPAVAVLALAVFFGVHHAAQTTAINQQSNAPLVAMSRADQLSPQNEAAPTPPAPAEPEPNATSGRLKSELPASSERDSLAGARQLALPAAAAPPLANKKDMPTDARNVDELQKSADAAAELRGDNTSQNASQSVEVTAAAPLAPTAQSAAPTRNESAPSSRAPAPSPSALAGSTGAITAGSGAGTANASPRSTTAETANRAQTQAPAAMSRFAGIAKSPSPQVAAEISTQKVFQTPNSNVLWRSADGGFVERSPDGGATWEGQPLPGISGEIAAGSSPAPKICWLVGSGGTIFMTKDASNWKKIAPPVSVDFTAVTANDASNATITAADGRKFQTTDSGKHWKPLP